MKPITQKNLGELLKEAREQKRVSLRYVEDKTGISNAYLSQLEGGKIKKPSPSILHKLSYVYEIEYSKLMKLAGYPVPERMEENSFYARIGETTKEEEDALLEYLDFYRARRDRGNQ